MLVSHQKQFIFLKTVKTASTSIEIYFQQYCTFRKKVSLKTGQIVDERGIIGSRSGWQYTDDRGYAPDWTEHMTATQVKEKIDDDIWDSYFKFCSVRNPYERAVSWFYFRPHPQCVTTMPRNEVIEYFELYTLNKFCSDREIYCVDNIAAMDDYIRVENMNEDMARICDRLNVEWKPESLGRELSSFRPEFVQPADLFTDATKKYIQEICAFEIDMFGYKFPDRQ